MAPQQLTSSMGSTLQGANSSGGTFSSFFSSTLTKPSYTAMSVKPTVPGPLNLSSMLPTFPSLQNTMLLRNMFGGTAATMSLPGPQVAPPKTKRKNTPFF